MSKPIHNDQLFDDVRQLILSARQQVVRSINVTMVATYFEIGKRMVEEEQHGKVRAEYSTQVLENLSERLSREFGKGFSRSNLASMRQFYLTYSPIVQTVSGQLAEPGKVQASSAQPGSFFKLSWSHYIFLFRIENETERGFYEIEAAQNNWSLRELKRQFSSALFERLALSTDKDKVWKLATEGQVIEKPQDLIKEPVVLEFLGLDEKPYYSESDLEQAILDKLQDFLLEMGKGFTFVARQYRITLEGRHYRIDLAFFNRILQCFFLVDLKIGDIEHQDIGQMQMYVNYFDREMRLPHEALTIGLILCRDKSESVVRYTLPEDNEQIFASRYSTVLPDKEALKKLLLEG
jgi:predicted nuclease of restriction endonuclease-like (RecB) superfamily